MFRKFFIFLFVVSAVAADACDKNVKLYHDERGLLDPICIAIDKLKELIVSMSRIIQDELEKAINQIGNVVNEMIGLIEKQLNWAFDIIDDIVVKANELNLDIRHCVKGKKEELKQLVDSAVAKLRNIFADVTNSLGEAVSRVLSKINHIVTVEIPDILNQGLHCGINPLCYTRLVARIAQITADLTAEVASVTAKLAKDVIDVTAEIISAKAQTISDIIRLVTDFEKCFEDAKENGSTLPPSTETPTTITTELPSSETSIEPTSEAPVDPTTEEPVESTTGAPIESTTETPVETTTGTPVDPTTEEPVESTTGAPIESTTETPVETTTGTTVEPTTGAPVESTTGAPVESTSQDVTETDEPTGTTA